MSIYYYITHSNIYCNNAVCSRYKDCRAKCATVISMAQCHNCTTVKTCQHSVTVKSILLVTSVTNVKIRPSTWLLITITAAQVILPPITQKFYSLNTNLTHLIQILLTLHTQHRRYTLIMPFTRPFTTILQIVGVI